MYLFRIILRLLRNKIIIIFFKRRDTIHFTSKSQDALVPSEAIQMIDVATEISNGVITENEAQTDMFHVRNKYEKKYK